MTVFGLRVSGEAFPATARFDKTGRHKGIPPGILTSSCVDEPAPRFSWKLSGETGLWQAAYRLRVASKREGLASPDLWDSGRIDSARFWAVPYEGAALPAFSTIHWSVEVWGSDGQCASMVSAFATGRQGTVWPSEWFSPAEEYGSMPVFRREAELAPGFTEARAYVCGLGSWEMTINGARVGEDELEPGWTNYDQSVLYAAYDVTALLKGGGNCLALMLGNGMYHIDQHGGRFAYSRHTFGPQKATVYIKITYPDGSVRTIQDADGWFSAPGPITFSCIYGGEDYDARLEIPGFTEPGFAQDSRWRAAKPCPPPKGALRGRQNPPVRVRRKLSPVSTTASAPGSVIYDMGRNFAGRIKVTAQGAPGETIRLHYAEMLKDGELLPFARSPEPYYTEYTFRGHEPETFCPRFTYLGFRYVKIETTARVLDIEGQDMFSDMPSGGEFACSNSFYNSIHSMIVRAIESNAKSVFTDCPHREKLGWLEQLHLIGPGILCNFDAMPMFRKMLADMREAQRPDGLVPNIAPEYRVFDWMPGFRDSPEWGSACILAAWQAYRASGDRAILAENYDMMARYARYLLDQSDHFILRHGLGDWLDVGAKKALAVNTPLPVTPTCTLYLDLATLARIAAIIGRPEDTPEWDALAGRVRAEFEKEFFNPKLAMYANGSQTALSMPLLFGMVSPEHAERVLDNLVDDIREKGDHITGGDVGHSYIFEALGRFGRSDVVADMLQKRDYPSYGYHADMGATTLPEAWDGADPQHPKGSQNHLMMGGIDAWFFRYLAGIQAETGEDAVLIRFAPAVVNGVDWARATIDTPAGEAKSCWQRNTETGRIYCAFTIPAGAVAEVRLPGRELERHMGQGTLEYVI